MAVKKNPTKGGRIPSDGRPNPAGGAGKQSRRHDISAPKRSTPFAHEAGMLQGDVQALEAGQKVGGIPSNKREQPPAQPQRNSSTRGRPDDPNGVRSGSQQSAGMNVPDPIQFMAGKGSGMQLPGEAPASSSSFKEWEPMLRHLMNDTTTSSMLKSLFIGQMSKMSRDQGQSQLQFIDKTELDNQLATRLGI